MAYNSYTVRRQELYIMAQNITGIIPAAGKATRLGPIPCSKEILPIGFIEQPGEHPELQLLTGLDHSLMAFADAGIMSAHIVISPEKSDIPKYVNKRQLHTNMDLKFSTVRNSPNILVSLDTPFAQYEKHDVALLFPDIIFEPRNLLKSLHETFKENRSDIVLGLFPTDHGHEMDVVSLSADGRVEAVRPKPRTGPAGHTWIAAIWNPHFSALLHEEAKNSITRGQNECESFIGNAVHKAILEGYRVMGVPFTDGRCCDLGTTANLRNFWRIQG
mgnify:CR=1 FL=1